MMIQNDVLSVDVVGNWISRLQFKGKHFMFPRQQLVYHPFNHESNIQMRGGSHPCFPFFGPAPAPYSDVRRHGWLRDVDGTLVRYNDCLIKSYSYGVVGGTDSYPWEIVCNVEYRIIDNALLIYWIFTRQTDSIKEASPFNLGLHHYWVNPNGIKSNIAECRNIAKGELMIDSRKMRWESGVPVEMDIVGVGKVIMSMEADGENQIVIWSDHDGFSCVEQLVDDPDNLGKSYGLHLESIYVAKFKLEFFD
jgi:hypothetical protein